MCEMAFAQVVINEYSTSNLESFYDNFGKTEDWIELYNTSNSTVDISGWHLSDKATKPAKWAIPEGTTIPGNGYLTFLCSGRDGFINGEYHTNFKLTQTKGSDLLLLSYPDSVVIEMFELELTLVEHSRCRKVDGGDEWQIGTSPSFGYSNDGEPQAAAYTETPELMLEAGFYEGEQILTIVNNEPNSDLHYTLDGHNPTQSSPIYDGPISVDETMVVKAQSFSNIVDILPGKMEFATYFIDEPDYTLAVFSVAADEVIDLANGDGPLIPIGSLEYFNLDDEREAVAYGSLNRHGQDSWALDHRSLDWVTRDEMGYTKAVDAPLFSYSERDEYQKFMFRNSGDDNYPAIDDGNHEGATHIRDEYVQSLGQFGGAELDNRAVERVILFLNGEYWGVYGMREKAADHDYTNEYYDQGKYDLQYLSTWGNTEIRYGGQKAVEDWVQLRDFILSSDMSIDSNYEIADDSINLTSLIDYMLMNLNVVASDWLNYNTGWWRGLNPEGKHKKWGYILWDLDASFDYYINYSGVPNISPNAEPCDLEIIGEAMDDFFGTGGGGGGGDPIDNPDICETVMDGSAPYPVTDTVFLQVLEADSYCCETEWDEVCQGLYNDFSSSTGGGSTNPGGNSDVGQHEKIFLKLLEESPLFQQLYYTRYADIMNTIFSCENMNTLLDSMLAVIEPEMPGQVARWGGTVAEWESNVQDLKDFINERCTLLDDGALSCYEDLSGPFTVTLMIEPEGIGEIDFNSLDLEELPWTGDYFGGVVNNIKTKTFNEFDESFEFSHWVSMAGNVIGPDSSSVQATITMETSDTLIAVYTPIEVIDTMVVDTMVVDTMIVDTMVTDTVMAGLSELMEAKYEFELYPNPASDRLVLNYKLESAMEVEFGLYNLTGQQVLAFKEKGGIQAPGKQKVVLPLGQELPSGLYVLEVAIGEELKSFKVSVIR